MSIFLESIANLLGVINEKFGDAAHAIVTLVDTFVLERDSLFARLVVGFLDLFFALVDLLVGIISGDIANAAEDFANAILDFIDLILDTIKDVLVTFVDDFIFGGTGIMACLVDLIDCIGDLVGDLVDELFSWGPAPLPEEGKVEILRSRATSQMVGALAYVFPETDSCRATLKRVAQLYVGREEGKDMFAELVWWQRWVMNIRTVGCVYRLEDQQYLEAYLDRRASENSPEAATTETTTELPRDGFGIRDDQNSAKFAGDEDYALHDALSEDAVCRREYYGDESGAGFFGSDSDPVCQIDAAVRVASRIRGTFDAIVVAAESGTDRETRNKNAGGAHSRQIARLGETFSELAGGMTEATYGLLLRSLLTANGGDIDKTAETIGRVQDIADSLFGLAWTTTYIEEEEDKLDKDADADRDFAALLWYLSGGDPAHQSEYGISVAVDVAPRFGGANFSGAEDNIILPRGFSDGDWVTQGTDYSEYHPDSCGHIIADAFGVWESGPIRPRTCPRTCPNCTDPASIISVQKICPIESCPEIMNDYPETLGMCARVCSGPQQSFVFRSSCRHKYLNGYGPIGYHPEVWVLASLSALTELSLRGMTAIRVAVLEAAEYAITGEFKNMVFDGDFNVTEYSGGVTYHTSDGDLTTGDVCTDVGRYGRPAVDFCNAKCNTGNPGSLYYRMTNRNGDLFQYGPAIPFGHEAYVNLLTQVCSAYCKPYDRTCAVAPRNMECTDGGALSIATCLRTCKLQWIPANLNSWNSSSDAPFVLPGFDPVDTFLPPCRPHSYGCNPLPKLFGNKTYPIARSCQCPPLWAGNLTEIANICDCSYEQVKKGNRLSPSTSSWLDFGCPGTFRSLQYTWRTDLDYVSVSLPMRPEIERNVTGNVTHTFYDIGDLGQASWDESKMFNGTEYPPLEGYLSVNVVAPQIIGTQCNDTETIISLSFSSNDTLCTDPLQICQIYEECREFIIPQTYALHRLENIEVEMTLDAQWLYPVDAIIGNSTDSECVWTDVVGLCDSRFCDSTATYISPSPNGTCVAERHCARGWWCPQSSGCDVSGLAWLNTTYIGNFSFNHRYDYISPFTHDHVFVCRNVTSCTVNGTLATCYNVSVQSPIVNVTQHANATCVNVTETAGGYPAKLKFMPIWGLITEGVAFPITFVGSTSSCDNPLVHTGDLCSYLCEDETGLEQDCYSLFKDVGLECETLRNDMLYPKNATFGALAARRWFCENIVPDFSYVDITAFPLAGKGMITPTWVDKIAAYSPSAGATSCVNGGQIACVMKPPTEIPDPIKTRLTDEECQLIRTLLEATYIPQIDDFSAQLYAAASDDERIDYPSLSLPHNLDWDPNVGRLDFVQACNYVGCEQGIGEATGVDENVPRSAPSENWRRRMERSQKSADEEERKCAKLGTISLKMVSEVERIREAAGEISDAEWIAILHARYGSPENFKDGENEILPSPARTIGEESEEFSVRRKRARDAEMIGRAILESYRKKNRAAQQSTTTRGTEIYEPPEDYCVEPTEPCPEKTCDIGIQYPAPCNRYPLPTGPLPPCERREYQCKGFAAEEPCTTWLADYLIMSDDPMGDYEEIFGEEVPLPEEQPTVEDLLVRIDDIRKMITDFFSNSNIGKTETASAAWAAASGQAKLTLEAMTCASMPWSAACGRLERAAAHSEGITRRQARTVLQSWTRTLATPITNIYDAAAFVREAAEWLPPADSLSRSCYLLCGYDYMHLFHRSCLEQADGVNGTVTQFLQAVVDIFGDICEYADLENGTDLLRPLSEIVPDLTKINFERTSSGTGSGSMTWGANFTIVSKIKIIVSKVLSCILGVPVEPGLAPGDIFVSAAASILGYDNSTEFMTAVGDWLKNTNIDPESGDVGALFWALFLTPTGANCASVNGTYKIFDIPIYSPLWFPALPTWLGNTTLSVVDFFAKLEWVVPDSMVVDADECYYDQEICEPLTENCPCSPKFENCGDRIGFTSPLDTAYFALNWWFPNAPNMRIVQIISMVTFTTPWLDKFTNITTSDVFYDDLFCFLFVGIPSSLWYLVFLGVILALAVVAFLLGIAWLKFLALISLAIVTFLLFFPLDQQIIYIAA